MATSAFDRLTGFRYDLASRAAALSFASNLTLMVLKVVVAVITGSVAVLSDAIDSAEDLVASTFAFWSIRVASQPADEGHPYGHGKAESIAAAAQGLLIAGGAAYIIFSAVQRLVDRDVEIDTTLGIVALVVTAAVNVGVVMYVGRAARSTGSMALRADTRHLWTNVAQAAGVVTALALVAITGNVIFDPIMALILAAYLIWTAGHVLMSALGEIMDVRLPPVDEEMIRSVLDHPEVRGFHGLRTRRSGRQRYVDVHLQCDPKATIAAAHELSDELERAIRARLSDAVVTIHLEPDTGDGGEGEHSTFEIGHPEREIRE
jgi:cation diffusion facilitator family transporter